MKVIGRLTYLVTALLVLVVTATAMAAPAPAKTRVAVLKFEDQSPNNYWGAGDGVADILTNKLIKEGKFDIMERTRLNDILAEQGLNSDGYLDPTTAVKSKLIKGVEVLIYGSVTKFTVKDTSVGIGKFRVGKSDAEVEIQLRMVDATTGSIMMAESAAAKTTVPRAEVWGRVHLDFSSSDFEASALGKATNKCLDELVEKINKKMENRPVKAAATLEGYVILVKSGVAYIDLGKNAVSVGAKFTVYKQGESIVHPITKEVIPGDLEKVGTITVTETQEKLSKCSIDALFGKSIEVGCKVIGL